MRGSRRLQGGAAKAKLLLQSCTTRPETHDSDDFNLQPSSDEKFMKLSVKRQRMTTYQWSGASYDGVSRPIPRSDSAGCMLSSHCRFPPKEEPGIPYEGDNGIYPPEFSLQTMTSSTGEGCLLPLSMSMGNKCPLGFPPLSLENGDSSNSSSFSSSRGCDEDCYSGEGLSTWESINKLDSFYPNTDNLGPASTVKDAKGSHLQWDDFLRVLESESNGEHVKNITSGYNDTANAQNRCFGNTTAAQLVPLPPIGFLGQPRTVSSNIRNSNPWSGDNAGGVCIRTSIDGPIYYLPKAGLVHQQESPRGGLHMDSCAHSAGGIESLPPAPNNPGALFSIESFPFCPLADAPTSVSIGGSISGSSMNPRVVDQDWFA